MATKQKRMKTYWFHIQDNAVQVSQKEFVLKSDYDEELQAANEVVKSLKDMMSKFKKAVEFYASKDNWASDLCLKGKEVYFDSILSDSDNAFSKDWFCGGKIAREILKEIQKLEGDL